MSDYNYGKIYQSIVRSSLWEESSDTRILFITMVVCSDKDGVILASTSGLAREANITLQACKAALEILQAPDLDSKDQSYGGRRVERIDSGGWRVLNKAKYRDLQSPEQLEWAEKKRRQREKEGTSQGRPGDIPGHPADTVSAFVGSKELPDKHIQSPSDIPGRPGDVPPTEAMAELRRIGEESKRAARGGA